jgi:Protein of unknown function (DUF1176)
MIDLWLFAAASAVSTPKPGELKTFTDWIVGCDNGRACQAVALMPDNDFDGTTMVIRRGAEALARPNVSISIQKGQAAALAVDGKRLSVRLENGDTEIQVDRRHSETLIGEMRLGQRLVVLDAGGREIGAPSLRGLSAALLYMDDQQRRVGTVTAFVRRGSKPASAVPPTPPLPIIVSPKVPKLMPVRLTKADIARATKPLECGADKAFVGEPISARLDVRTSLALLPYPCGNGAYNLFSFAFLIDNSGKVRIAAFDSNPGMGPEDDSSLVNADWDEAKRRLTTYAKGRGLGDCGVTQSFAWDGTRFRLAELASMGECRGSVDYITTWRAAVR